MPSPLPPHDRRDQSRALSLQRLSPPSSLLWAPRTPSRHGGISPSAYTRRLRPTWAVEEGLPSSASGCPCVPSSLPRERPAPLRLSGAVCCLRPEMMGSATPPFGFLSHEAAKFTLPHWARRFAPLARGHTASAGLLTLRSDAAISAVARSLLRGAPALTAAGLPPASLMQHLGRIVQARPRSGRTMAWIVTVEGLARGPLTQGGPRAASRHARRDRRSGRTGNRDGRRGA